MFPKNVFSLLPLFGKEKTAVQGFRCPGRFRDFPVGIQTDCSSNIQVGMTALYVDLVQFPGEIALKLPSWMEGRLKIDQGMETRASCIIIGG